MKLFKQIEKSLRWKKNDEYCSTKLGISVEEYQFLKKQFLNSLKGFNLTDSEVHHSNSIKEERIIEFKEDLESGTAHIKGISFTEPHSPDEIIKILKIDTEKWKLSSYWNKQSSDHWLISALVTQKKLEPTDYLKNTLDSFKPDYQPVTNVFLNEKFQEHTCGILSIQDLHFGKEDNEDVIHHFKLSIENLIHRAYMSHYIDRIIYVIGGDLLNMDTFNGTTTSGTPVDNDKKAQNAYDDAFDAIYWSVNYIKQFCKNLDVVYLPGNHDRLSSYHLAHGISKCFPNDPSINFDVQYAERKVVTYGSNFFAFEHGDVTKKNTPLVYATEFSKEWGYTKYRTCYTGHFHSKKTVEFVTENEHNGFAIKHLPSLSSTDYWHYHNKFIGSKRQAIIEMHDFNKGKISEFIYTA